MICKNCGMENPDTAKFCTGCGARLEKEVLKCPSCGAVLEGKPSFCPSCGHKLDQPKPAEPAVEEPTVALVAEEPVVEKKPDPVKPEQPKPSKFARVMDIIIKAFSIFIFLMMFSTLFGAFARVKMNAYAAAHYSGYMYHNYNFLLIFDMLEDGSSLSVGSLIAYIVLLILWILASVFTTIFGIIGIIKTAKSFRKVGVTSVRELATITFFQMMYFSFGAWMVGTDSRAITSEYRSVISTGAGWGMTMLMVLLIMFIVLAMVNGIVGSAVAKKKPGPAILRAIIIFLTIFFPYMLTQSFFGLSNISGSYTVKSGYSLLYFINYEGRSLIQAAGDGGAYYGAVLALAIMGFMFEIASFFFVISSFTKTLKRVANPEFTSRPAPFLLTAIFTLLVVVFGTSTMSVLVLAETSGSGSTAHLPYCNAAPVFLIIFGVAGFVLSIIEKKRYAALNPAPAKR